MVQEKIYVYTWIIIIILGSRKCIKKKIEWKGRFFQHTKKSKKKSFANHKKDDIIIINCMLEVVVRL